MSFSSKPQRPFRLHRSELAVPATSGQFFAKAASSSADVIFLDLEDAVSPNRKVEGREAAISALNSIDWNTKTMAVRVNGLDTEWGQRDILEVVSRCARLDLVLIPKVGTPFDVTFVDALLTGLERELRLQKKVGIEILIESTLGMANVEAIASCCARLEAMIFGVGDYTIDLGTAGEAVGMPDPRYVVQSNADESGGRHSHWNDQYHFAIARLANACKANGLRAIDGPYSNFADTQGYAQSASRAAALGCEGKWAIHPSQIAPANAAFSPTEKQVTWARKIMCAIEASSSQGTGAFAIDGVLIDMAFEKIAHSILKREEAIVSATANSSPGARS